MFIITNLTQKPYNNFTTNWVHCLWSTEAITTFQIWDTIPFHSLKMMLKPLVIQKELYLCTGEKTSMHIVPKCVQSIYLEAENLQQPYHIYFPSLLCTSQYRHCLLTSAIITAKSRRNKVIGFKNLHKRAGKKSYP